MQTFLDRLAREIISKHPDNLGEIAIVLPSRRAIVFLREAFKRHLKVTSWLPKIFSIEDFIYEHISLIKIDRIDLVIELYQVHLEIEGNSAEDLSEFMKWADILIHDFNEIDIHLVDAKALYGYLTEAKALESWELGEQDFSTSQQNYLRFWKKLILYYEQYNQRLRNKGIGYQGMAYRELAESKISEQEFYDKYDRIYFGGFNALTASEEYLMNKLIDADIASIYWDTDEYYMGDTNQEAGLFLRSYQDNSESFNWLNDILIKGEKHIDIIGVTGNVAQSKLIGKLIDDSDEFIQTNTAVVLADETLLVPVLEALPERLKSVNATMGYPMSSSIFYQWYKQLFRLLQENNSEKENGVPFKDLLDLFSSSIFHNESSGFYQKVKETIDSLKSKNLIVLDNQQLKNVDQSLGFSIFTTTSTVLFMEELIKLNNQFKTTSYHPIENVSLLEIDKVFNRLLILGKENFELLNLDSLIQIFEQLVSSLSVPFEGEPLEGLQLMGVLESRVLDFDRLIIASVNEGILPKSKSNNSFIPYDIKRKFKLPLHHHKDAIFAYHFYRLLQHPKQITILYNNSTDQLFGGEKSRFIRQIMHELQAKNKQIQIRESQASAPLLNRKNVPFEISNNVFIDSKIKDFFANGISPSSIISYYNCPLDFYYQYLLKVRSKTIDYEQLDDGTIGTIVHKTLEYLYQEYLDNILDKKAIQAIKNAVSQTLEIVFQEVCQFIPRHGRLRISFEAAEQLIREAIRKDEIIIDNKSQLIIKKLETKMEVELDNILDLPLKSIKLKGNLDRLDELNGKLRLIDYKTAMVESKDLRNLNFENLTAAKKNKALQLLMYGFLARANDKKPDLIGIYSLKNRKEGFIELTDDDDNIPIDILKSFVLELTNGNKVFTHNESSLHCEYCI